jgi:hypothetical protein
VQEIAAQAFPDAASAMLLTTATTAVAFFGTAICPVAPIKLFAIFVAVMIVSYRNKNFNQLTFQSSPTHTLFDKPTDSGLFTLRPPRIPCSRNL